MQRTTVINKEKLWTRKLPTNVDRPSGSFARTTSAEPLLINVDTFSGSPMTAGEHSPLRAIASRSKVCRVCCSGPPETKKSRVDGAALKTQRHGLHEKAISGQGSSRYTHEFICSES